MQKSNPVAAILSFVFLCFLLASLGGRFWASAQASKFVGPTHLAADSGQLFIVAAERIYHLSAAGELLSQHPIEVAGLTDIPIDLRMRDDSKLLIASQRPAQIRVCDTSNWECLEMGATVPHRPQRQFKVLPDTKRNVLWLTDARDDNLWAWEVPDSASNRVLPEHSLAGPNDLAFDEQGHIWVADTDHRRIIELIPASGGEWEFGRVHSAVNDFTRGKRYYPLMLALGSDGNWWVSQASEFSDDLADLLVYHPDQGAIAQITLPGSVMATDVASSGEDIIVTDLETYTVYRVNAHTRSVSIFGDETFLLAMTQLKSERGHFERLGHLAMVAVVVFGILMVIAAVFATPKNKRWTPVKGLADLSVATEAVPPVKGIYWLQRNERLDRWLKRLALVGLILLVLFLAGSAIFYLWIQMGGGIIVTEEQQTELQMLGLVVLISCLFLGVVMIVVNQSLKGLKTRLGTDGKRLHIRLHDGRELSVSPADLAYSRRAIFYRQYTLPLQGGKNQKLYLDGELETWIAPLLRQAKNLNEWQALKYQWKHNDLLLVWSVVAGIAGGIALILLAMLRN